MSQNQITNAGPATAAQKKLIARTTGTENYFNGTNFSATRENALKLRPGTTAADFTLLWQNPVEVVKADLTNASYALRIHHGEFDKYGAAKRFVIENGGVSKSGKSHKSYSIRIADGKYISRKIHVPKSSRPGETEAWIPLRQSKCDRVEQG